MPKQKQPLLLDQTGIKEEKEEFGELVRKVHDEGLKKAKTREIYPMDSFLKDIFKTIDTGETARVLDRVMEIKDQFINEAMEEVFGKDLKRRIQDARKGKLAYARQLEKLKREGIETLSQVRELPGQDMRQRAEKAQNFSDEKFMADYFHFQSKPELKADYEFDWKVGDKKPDDSHLSEILGLLSQSSEEAEKREESKEEPTRANTRSNQHSVIKLFRTPQYTLDEMFEEELTSHERSAGISIKSRKKKRN